MRVLTFLTFVIAMIFMVVMDIFLFSEDVLYGIGGIIGIRINRKVVHQANEILAQIRDLQQS